ncbi:MAG: right-handed parallel beta-helix repeat-containing protein [bacterium]
MDTASATYYDIEGDYSVDDGFSMHGTTTAVIYGGVFQNNDQGINIINQATLIATNVTSINNTTYSLYLTLGTTVNATIINGLFSDAKVYANAGVATFSNCIFTDSPSWIIEVDDEATVNINRSIIHDVTAANHSVNTIINSGSTININSSSIYSIASTKYGVVCRTGNTCNLKNVTFYDSDKNGKGLYAQGTSTVQNCIFNNLANGITSATGHSTSSTTLSNNDFYGNTADFSGTGLANTNGLAVDPLFVNATGADFSLQSTSTLIDAGTNLGNDYDDAIYPGSTWPSSVTTADQDLRGLGWEIGAYIYPVPQASTIGTPSVLTSSSIRWGFIDNANDETGFRVYTNADAIATSSATANLTYLDETGLSENTQYTRHIKAYNSYGESASSSATSTYTLADTPTGFNFMRHPLSVDIYVDAFPNPNSGLSGYLFWRIDNSAYNSGWIQTREWRDPNMVEGTTYTYAVKYRNANGVETATTTMGGVVLVHSTGGGGTPNVVEPELQQISTSTASSTQATTTQSNASTNSAQVPNLAGLTGQARQVAILQIKLQILAIQKQLIILITQLIQILQAELANMLGR